MSEKLQKVLASVGLGSRRQMEEMISAGRVSVNGKVAQLGDRVEVGDELRLDGRKVQFQAERDKRRRVIIYYKPEGEICSRHDPEGRPTVFDHLPTISRDRWVMVGRLDINSSGLLLFTNDGELANRLMHPSNEVQREYAARVMGEVSQQQRQALLRGVELDDGFAKFESFADLGGEGFNRWYQVVVKEGRNREVRRLFESQGLKVSRLLRTRYGVIHLPRELRTGRWLELDQLAINVLAKSVNLSSKDTVKFDESEKRRIDKMLDNPMKARYIDDSARQRRTGTSTEHRVVKQYNSYDDYRQNSKNNDTDVEQKPNFKEKKSFARSHAPRDNDRRENTKERYSRDYSRNTHSRDNYSRENSRNGRSERNYRDERSESRNSRSHDRYRSERSQQTNYRDERRNDRDFSSRSNQDRRSSSRNERHSNEHYHSRERSHRYERDSERPSRPFGNNKSRYR